MGADLVWTKDPKTGRNTALYGEWKLSIRMFLSRCSGKKSYKTSATCREQRIHCPGVQRVHLKDAKLQIEQFAMRYLRAPATALSLADPAQETVALIIERAFTDPGALQAAKEFAHIILSNSVRDLSGKDLTK